MHPKPLPRKVRPTSSEFRPYCFSNRSDVEEVTIDQTVYTMLPYSKVIKTSFSNRKVRGASMVLKVTLPFFPEGVESFSASFCPQMV